MNAADFPNLDPRTQSIVKALFDAPLQDEQTYELTDEALARFACGWITPEESDQVISALTTSSVHRERLLELRADVATAQASPAERKRIFEKDTKLAQVMGEALRASVNLLSSWSKVWTPGANLAAEEYRSLRSILADLGDKLQQGGLAPAFSRGAAQAAKVVVEPGNVFAELSVHVNEDNSLTASAQFSQPFDEPKEVSLYVVEPGGAWSWIGSDVASGSRWTLNTPQYADMLGLPAGDVTSHSFALSEGRWLMPRGWVALHIGDKLRGRGISSPTRLRLRRPPVITGGEFVIGFEFTQNLRELFSEDHLTLSIMVGSAQFVLASWKVRDLPQTAEVELRAPSAGLHDCEFESYSAIHLTLRD